MFNLGLPEIIVLLVIGIVFFGPEQLPDLAKKLARVVKYLQKVANGARETLVEHAGPEFANLEISDLTPQKLAAKYLGEAMREIEDVKSDLAGVRSDLDQVVGQATTAINPEPVAVLPAPAAANPTSASTTQLRKTRPQHRIRQLKAANRPSQFQRRGRRR